jgi:RNA polymerase sigma-70 factor (ECF subfamily)
MGKILGQLTLDPWRARLPFDWRHNSVKVFEESKMSRIGFGSPAIFRFGTSSPQDRTPSTGFEELAMPLFDSLYNFACWLVHNDSDAEDLVQETYRKTLLNFGSFQPGTNFRAWMFRVLKNTFLSSRSRLERRSTVSMDSEEDGPELAVESETPETILIERLNRELVQGAIDELPLHFREALMLCEVEEMSYKEIAEILSIPIGTVMSRLARARKAVRESLGSNLVQQPRSKGVSHRRNAQEGFRFLYG